MGRERIGLLFYFNNSWTGGHYYLLNIIRALGKLPIERRPHIVLFTYNGSRPDLEDVHYEFLSFKHIKKRFTLFERLLRKAGILKKDYIPAYSRNLVRFIYPHNGDYHLASLRKLTPVYWLPDFQHKYLIKYFSYEELRLRDIQFKEISLKTNKLVLSSSTAKADFIKFYPEHKNEVFVIPFASILPEFSSIPIDKLRVKYNLLDPYFISPNQFWAHKNHQVILEALLYLKSLQVKTLVVFTGNENDYRNPGYMQSLKDFVKENKLEAMVRFLGFLDRSDQLQLMNYAIAVIQPSLFEGWSTVIEDSKCINQFVISSTIEVHKEQLKDYPNAKLFDPYDPKELANQLQLCNAKPPERVEYCYENKVIEFANRFMKLME